MTAASFAVLKSRALPVQVPLSHSSCLLNSWCPSEGPTGALKVPILKRDLAQKCSIQQNLREQAVLFSFFFFLIRFFGCSCGFLHTLSDLCANALTLSALLLGPVMHIFVLCRKCCPWGGTLDPFVLLLCVTKTVS